MTIFSYLLLNLVKANGPRIVDAAAGVDAAFEKTCRRALKITRNHQAWPTTYGREEPILIIDKSNRADFSAPMLAKEDPIRMAQKPGVIVVGDGLLTRGSSVLVRLKSQGFSAQQLLVLTLAHEAYHSNEGQRMQRCKVSSSVYLSPNHFCGAIHPEFPQQAQEAIKNLSSVEITTLADESRFNRLCSKVLEGAADVHAVMVFARIYPEETENLVKLLAVERHVNHVVPREGNDNKDGYDNADCLLRLSKIPIHKWPQNQLECSTFSWQHALPFLKKARVLQNYQGDVEKLEKTLFSLGPSVLFLPKINIRDLRELEEHRSTGCFTPRKLK